MLLDVRGAQVFRASACPFGVDALAFPDPSNCPGVPSPPTEGGARLTVHLGNTLGTSISTQCHYTQTEAVLACAPWGRTGSWLPVCSGDHQRSCCAPHVSWALGRVLGVKDPLTWPWSPHISPRWLTTRAHQRQERNPG